MSWHLKCLQQRLARSIHERVLAFIINRGVSFLKNHTHKILKLESKFKGKSEIWF